MNILLIEESKVLRGTLHDGLTKLGYSVDTVANGINGIKISITKNYQVIIVDLNLTDNMFSTLIELIRGLNIASRIIIVSSNDIIDASVTSINQCPIEYIEKPFGFTELNALIDKKPDATNYS